MSQGSGFVPSADDVVYFKDPDGGIDVESQLDELSKLDQGDLTVILTRLWKYPELLDDVRRRVEPVRAISFNGRLWVVYWVHTQPRGNPAATWRCLVILVISVLHEPSSEVPEPEFALALERYARDLRIRAGT